MIATETASTVEHLPLLLASLDADSPVLWRDGAPISRRTLLGQALRTAATLPERPHVANLCRDRHAFIVGLLAAVLRGHLTVLPNDRAPATLWALSKRYPGLYALSDGDEPSASLDAYPVSLEADGGDDPFPSIEADQTIAEVFTSGSTGQPSALSKTWRLLSTTGALIDRRLGFRGGAAIVATVPPQHMYGLETSVFWPLFGTAAVHADRPFYPADIRDCLAGVPGPRVLVTTPVHLRALVSSCPELPELAKIISATAPLTSELAAQAEGLYNAPVYEIFGFSEAGTIATRRTVDQDVWTLCDSLSIIGQEGNQVIDAPHYPRPVPFNDIVEVRSPTEFILLGRNADTVNIAGKRASLGALNLALGRIEGVQDGAFYLPPSADDERVVRLVAFIVAPGRALADIKRELARRIDPAFMPRRLYRVERLPRAESGKLPSRALNDLYQCFAGRRDCS